MRELPKELQDALGITQLPAQGNDFETQLMLFLHNWIGLISLDKVIEGLDLAVQTLETRRDMEIEGNVKKPPPAPSPQS